MQLILEKARRLIYNVPVSFIRLDPGVIKR